jgi:hypothetical protein
LLLSPLLLILFCKFGSFPSSLWSDLQEFVNLVYPFIEPAFCFVDSLHGFFGLLIPLFLQVFSC